MDENLNSNERVPTGQNMSFADERFIKYEETGVKEAKNAAFVLVAGGFGEHLGYNEIKGWLSNKAFALCYGKFEAAVLAFIIPTCLLGHLTRTMVNEVKTFLMGVWVTFFAVFSGRKFIQPFKKAN